MVRKKFCYYIAKETFEADNLYGVWWWSDSLLYCSYFFTRQCLSLLQFLSVVVYQPVHPHCGLLTQVTNFYLWWNWNACSININTNIVICWTELQLTWMFQAKISIHNTHMIIFFISLVPKLPHHRYEANSSSYSLSNNTNLSLHDSCSLCCMLALS